MIHLSLSSKELDDLQVFLQSSQNKDNDNTDTSYRHIELFDVTPEINKTRDSVIFKVIIRPHEIPKDYDPENLKTKQSRALSSLNALIQVFP